MLKKTVKSTLEAMSGHKVLITHSAPNHRIQEVMNLMHPVGCDIPLVRLGPDGDGGYLLPSDLDGVFACVSPGVSTESRFDLEMAERGMRVYMADASVEAPTLAHKNFYFMKKFIGVDNQGDFIRMRDIYDLARTQSFDDLILQMDIEGAEYEVILDMDDEVLQSFRIMSIEFHSLPEIFSEFPMRLIEAVFKKLNRYHHVVHIHPNNACGGIKRGEFFVPQAMEFTLLRKDRANFNPNAILSFPHPLDIPNALGQPIMPLPKCWRRA